MMALSPRRRAAELRHLRAPVPVRFPESEEMPEGHAHLILRTFVYQLLRYALGPGHTVGSDQFIYWLPTDPRRCLAPDVYVKLGEPAALCGSWKSWERGAPELAIEILSPHGRDWLAWGEKLARYAELGVEELLCFDGDRPDGQRMRAWDRVDGDFVEREVQGDETPCVTLGLAWVVRPVDIVPVGLRLVDGAGVLVPSEVEALAEKGRLAEVARASAEARVRELEEELRRRR